MMKNYHSRRKLPPDSQSWEEDQTKMVPNAIFWPPSKLLLPNFQLRHSHNLLRTLGTKLPCAFMDLEETTMTLKGREKSFPDDWLGPSPAIMAAAGLYYQEGKPRCYICGVSFRGLNISDQCPWQRHKELAPNCLHLRRTSSSGHSHLVDGPRPRRSSTSSADCLMAAEVYGNI